MKYFNFINIFNNYLSYSFAPDTIFEEIIKSCSHVESLVFHTCKFSWTSSLDFEGPEYKIKKISFQGSGDSHENNWFDDHDKFNKFVIATANSSLKDSLETIYIILWGINAFEVRQMLETNNMHHIQVDEDNWI